MGRRERYCGQFRMKVNPTENKMAAKQIVSETIDPKSVLFTINQPGMST